MEEGTRWAIGSAISIVAVMVGVLSWQYPHNQPSATPGATKIRSAVTTPMPSSPSASATTSASSSISNVGYYQLQAGDCLTGSNNLAKIIMSSSIPWPNSTQVVSCNKPHIAEVFFADHSYWRQNESFPGKNSLDSSSLAACYKAFESYIGVVAANSKYIFDYLYPDSPNWLQRDRTVICVAYKENSVNSRLISLNKSVKGADQ